MLIFCYSTWSNRVVYFRLEIIPKNFIGISVGVGSSCGAYFQKRSIWKRDKASAITLCEPWTWTALNCVLLHIVKSTKGRSNFMTDWDFDVLLFIIVTNAWLSILKRSFLPTKQEAHNTEPVKWEPIQAMLYHASNHYHPK